MIQSTAQPYGPGGQPATLIHSGQSALDRGYAHRSPSPVVLSLPDRVPRSQYVPPGTYPSQVGPASVSPPGPLGPLSLPHVWPGGG